MTTTRGTKFVHEGDYVATVEIEWLESEAGWSPYLSWQDAQKLDDVREALRRRDLKAAGQLDLQDSPRLPRRLDASPALVPRAPPTGEG